MYLKKCETYDLKTLRGPSDYLTVANSIDALGRIEVCMKGWTKQIEQVIHWTDVKCDNVCELGDDEFNPVGLDVINPRILKYYWHICCDFTSQR